MTSSLVRLKPDTTLKDALHSGDPIALEGEMGATEAAGLKRSVMAAAGGAPAQPLIVNVAFAAIPLSIVLVLGSALRESLITAVPRKPALAHANGSTGPARQLYFQTEGGTRVIWIFTPGSDEGEK